MSEYCVLLFHIADEILHQKAKLQEIADSLIGEINAKIQHEYLESRMRVEQKQSRLTENVENMKKSITKVDNQP
jgi:hypothetical protein